MMTSMLLVSVLAMAGADAAAPAPAPAAPAPVVVSSTGCSGCGSAAPTYSFAPSCYDPCARRGLFGFGIVDRLRGRFATIGSRFAPACPSACAPAPVVSCAPACAPSPSCTPACPTVTVARTPLLSNPLFTGCQSSVCDPCARVSILDRIRGIFARPKWNSSCTSTIVGGTCGCGTEVSAPAVTPATPEAPKEMPKPAPKETPKEAPKTTLAPSIGTLPVLGGTNSNY